jgi:hypothetical protein
MPLSTRVTNTDQPPSKRARISRQKSSTATSEAAAAVTEAAPVETKNDHNVTTSSTENDETVATKSVANPTVATTKAVKASASESRASRTSNRNKNAAAVAQAASEAAAAAKEAEAEAEEEVEDVAAESAHDTSLTQAMEFNSLEEKKEIPSQSSTTTTATLQVQASTTSTSKIKHYIKTSSVGIHYLIPMMQTSMAKIFLSSIKMQISGDIH